MKLPIQPRRLVQVALCAITGLAGCAPGSDTPPDRLQQFAIGSPDIVISQVYGGGGNSGAQFKNDFVELFNRSAGSVTVDGWSVQYASATGTSWA